MAHKIIVQSYKFALCLALTTSIYAAAHANDAGAYQNPDYAAGQSLPQLTPDQIAADVEARFDPLTGRTEYIGRDFDPFENTGQMAGSALLRSASTGISRDGVSISGGAYLDVAVMYSSASRDPYDSKGYEHAVYMNGQPVDVMSYDVQTLDCTRDITKVTYDDGYYRGSSYGYVGGLYRLFPRYRGHSHYHSHRNRIRYGSWRGLRHNYHGHRGYDRRHGDRNRGHDYGHDGHDSDGGRNHRDRDGRNRDQYVDIRDRVDQNEDRRDRDRDRTRRVPDGNSISTYNVIRPDMLGDRRIPSVVDRSDLNRRPVKDRMTRPVMQPIKTPPTTRRAAPPVVKRPVIRRTEITRPDRPNERRIQASPAREVIRPARSAPAQPHTARRVFTPPARVQNNQASSRPKQTAPRKPPKARSETRSRPSSTPKARRVDKAFKSRNKSSARPFRYYPGQYTQTATYVDTRCVKEERLSLHIPADRLEAARFDGLSLVLLDRQGQDVPVYIPPNYIEGFRRANPYLRRNSYHAPAYAPSHAPAAPHTTYPQSGG